MTGTAPRSPAARLPAAIIFGCLILGSASAQAPTAVIERTVTVGGRTVRSSLFSNRVAVVTIRYNDKQAVFRKRTLEEEEFLGYLAAFQRDAKELADADRRPSLESIGGRAEITLRVGPNAPQTISYSPVSVLDLPTSRLVAAIDDIERRVMWGDPSPAELEGWEPRRGDRVELRSGARATVVDVGEDGNLTLEHDDTWILEIVPYANRAAVILQVIEDSD